MRKVRGIPIVLLAVLLTSIGGAVAGAFYITFNQIPFEPSEYNFQEPWEVVAVVNFCEATLVITGTGYSEQSHDLDLTIMNISPEPDYYLRSFSYDVDWSVGASSENMISGNYLHPKSLNLYLLAAQSFTSSFIPSWLASY